MHGNILSACCLGQRGQARDRRHAIDSAVRLDGIQYRRKRDYVAVLIMDEELLRKACRYRRKHDYVAVLIMKNEIY
jgi:hypothetical protein